MKQEGKTHEDVIDVNVNGSEFTWSGVITDIDGDDTWRTEFTEKFKKL